MAAQDIKTMLSSRNNHTDLFNKLSKCIEADDDPTNKIALLGKEHSKGARNAMREALQAKSVEHGRNLLMHAAASGKERWFLALVREIDEVHLGRATLVRQLRELDVNGLPLLFHAVSSDEIKCLQAVTSTITKTLGVSGLSVQLYAVDKKGRNAMMYAVRSSSTEVYDKLMEMLPEHSVWEWKRELECKDTGGRTLLHYAAETPCKEILRKVIELANGSGAKGLIGGSDDRGRTPVMYVLRNTYGVNKLKTSHEVGCNGDAADENGDPVRCLIQAKLDMLFTAMKNNAKQTLKSLTQPPGQPSIANQDAQAVKSPGAQVMKCEEMPTALMHAARGGPIAFGVAVSKIEELLKQDHQCMNAYSPELHLQLNFINAALGVDAEPEDADIRRQRQGMLLAAAASRGHVDVLKKIVTALSAKQTNDARAAEGRMSAENKSSEEPGGRSNSATVLHNAIDSIGSTRKGGQGKSLLSLAIGSGDISVVEYVIMLDYYQKTATTKEEWDRLCRGGQPGAMRALACIASTTSTDADHGELMFGTVFSYLREAALKYFREEEATQTQGAGGREGGGSRQGISNDTRDNDQRGSGDQQGDQERRAVQKLLCAELVVSRSPNETWTLSPLGGAVLTGNDVMFNLIYKTYEDCGGEWDGSTLLGQLWEMKTKHAKDVPENNSSDGGIVANVPQTMWYTITRAFKDAQRGAKPMRDWRDYFGPTGQLMAEQGNFDDLRALVKERYPLHAHIPILLERIGDDEDNVIDTVSLALVYASNPLVVWAIASRDVSKAEMEISMHKNGLRRLQKRLDALIEQLLDNLPHTVRGVGREIVGHRQLPQPVNSHCHRDLGRRRERKRDRTIDLVGFIIVRWMLEPKMASAVTKDGKEDPNELIDPLQHALDRGSKGLAFVNSALVLDYLHLKFWNTLPSWTSRNPFHDTIKEDLYSYYLPHEFGRHGNTTGNVSVPGCLLSFLQGWDVEDGNVAPAEVATEFPHSTLLPGFQFTLAGIIGKPVAFYEIPAVRFMLELLSYLVMLALFCWSVKLERSDDIPPQEWVFYTFVLGLLFRECLEFRQALPERRKRVNNSRSGRQGFCIFPKKQERRPQHRVSAAASRYLFHDTWNILDTLTILMVAGAFGFRIMALGDHWAATDERDDASPQGNFFMAQLLLALSSPLLFARVLFLSQIDDTLGPMTQIIWTMISHLARFSVFLLVLITGFALAFYALLHTCDDNDAVNSFGTFWASILTMFEAMLGGFDFEVFHSADSCNRPDWAYDASVWLLVSYEFIMAILLLNLLIAVLSTVHSSVDAHAEEEFNLSRAKLIVQTDRGVANCRLPPPLNLIKAAIGCVVDVPYAVGVALNTPGTNGQDLSGEGSDGGEADGKAGERSATRAGKGSHVSSSLGGPQETCNSRESTAAVRNDEHVDEHVDEEEKEGERQEIAPSSTTIAAQEKGTRRWGKKEWSTKPETLHTNVSEGEPVHGDVATSAPSRRHCKRGDVPQQDASEGEPVHGVEEIVETGMKNEECPCVPFSESYMWNTIEGGIHKLVFAFTMGVTAVALSAVLWIVSTPWIAWRILRWAYPAGCSPWKGYTWTVAAILFKLIGWGVVCVATCVMCLACVVASAALWLCGVCCVFEWVWWRQTEGLIHYRKEKCRVVRPGEERGTDWKEARKIVQGWNHAQDGSDTGHFNVGPLLKMTTGWDMTDLYLHAKHKGKGEKMLLGGDMAPPLHYVSPSPATLRKGHEPCNTSFSWLEYSRPLT